MFNLLNILFLCKMAYVRLLQVPPQLVGVGICVPHTPDSFMYMYYRRTPFLCPTSPHRSLAVCILLLTGTLMYAIGHIEQGRIRTESPLYSRPIHCPVGMHITPLRHTVAMPLDDIITYCCPNTCRRHWWGYIGTSS